MAAFANRFGKHRWWILTVLLTAPLLALAADVPHMFTAGTVISSTEVNENFKNLSDRVTALENAKTNVTVVMDNVTGALPATGKTAVFTTAGGPLMIIASGMGWQPASGGTLDVAVQLDGNTIGHLKGFTNETGSHKTLPTKVFQVPAPMAGSHTLGLIASATTTDTNDYFNVTVIEYR